jgi:hypothetical protein
MHDDALPFCNDTVIVPPHRVGADLAFLRVQLPRHVSGQWKGVGWEKRKLSGPLAGSKTLHLRPELVSFLLNARELVVEGFAFLGLARERAGHF